MSAPVSAAGAVLVLNSGSSSVKYELVHPDSERVLASGVIEEVRDHQVALAEAFVRLGEAGFDLVALAESGQGLLAVGHRVVHGGLLFSEPVLVTDAVMEAIEGLQSLAPLHNPANAAGIAAVTRLLPGTPQVAVFDTAFFAQLPEAASTYAIDVAVARPRGLRRYGFHGTSHDYVSQTAAEFLGKDRGSINQIVAHLGNGASVSAIERGRAVDTSMGMTPLEGLVMGTRSGDIDAGLVLHLSREVGMSVEAIDDLLNRHSGLRGMAGVSDFRELGRLRDAGDPAALLAYEVYIHRLRKYLGAYAFCLGRVHAISFTAGVGENDARVRADALDGLEPFGIVLDLAANAAPPTGRGVRVISAPESAVTVLVTPTNEELAIARAAVRVLRTKQ